MTSDQWPVTSKGASENLDRTIGEIVLVERAVSELLTAARHALVEAEEENRRLRREVAQAEINWYTEKQLAARMGVSKDTLARLRKKKKIPFVRVTPTIIRYSTVQEVEIAEVLAQPVAGGQLSVVRKRRQA